MQIPSTQLSLAVAIAAATAVVAAVAIAFAAAIAAAIGVTIAAANNPIFWRAAKKTGVILDHKPHQATRLKIKQRKLM